jgi:hypothetical protein
VSDSESLYDRVIALPATFDTANRPKNKRTLSLKFSTTEDVSTEIVAKLDKLLGTNGWVCFKLNEFDENDIPYRDASGRKRDSEWLQIQKLLTKIALKHGADEELPVYVERRLRAIRLQFERELKG